MFLIISQISQMNQISNNIVLICKTGCIILERSHINENSIARKHFNNRTFKTIKIQIDKRNYCLIRRCSRPVALKIAFKHQINNCIRIINMILSDLITIIPTLYFFKILFILCTQIMNFVFCKANIWRNGTRIQHSIILKIIQC